MSWTKVCDTILDHPKFRDLDDKGWSLWVRALVWSNKHRTDGLLPATVVARLGGTRAVVRDLVHRRIWEPAPNRAYQIHDFLDYNLDQRGQRPPPSPELRAVRAEAGRRGAQSRWHGRADGTASQPRLANLPSAVTPVVTPGYPSTRDPGQRHDRGAPKGWSATRDLVTQIRERFPAPPEDPEESA